MGHEEFSDFELVEEFDGDLGRVPDSSCHGAAVDDSALPGLLEGLKGDTVEGGKGRVHEAGRGSAIDNDVGGDVLGAVGECARDK